MCVPNFIVIHQVVVELGSTFCTKMEQQHTVRPLTDRARITFQEPWPQKKEALCILKLYIKSMKSSTFVNLDLL